MPKRIVRRRSLEVETERIPLTPSLDRRLKKVAQARAPKLLDKWHIAAEPKDQFYAAPDGATAAFSVGQYELAESIAQTALSLAPDFQDNWNYSNAIHKAHTVLGLLALRVGDREAAIRHLWASGEVNASPQLGSFGPSMWLARDLLRAGETGPVVQYLQQCRTFWSMGQEWLRIWELKVRRGSMPTFFMQLYK